MIARQLRAAATALLLGLAAPLAAQSYPSKPIKIVMPFPPGGTNDIVARALAERLTPVLKQPVVVENRAGAGGRIGTEIVTKAPPDGHTLLVSNAGSLAAGVSLYPNVPYNVLRDFAAISLLADTTIVLAAHPSVPAKSPRELIALAKARPGKLNAAIPGNGTLQHLVTEMFRLRAGISFASVPYRGSAPALLDLIAGQTDMIFVNLPTILELIRAGRLKAIAVAGAQRSELLSEVPTLNEAALPGLVATPWIALVAPAATPRDIITRLNAEVTKIMRTPEMKQYLVSQGANPLSSTPEDTQKFIRDEIGKWAKVVQDANIRVE